MPSARSKRVESSSFLRTRPDPSSLEDAVPPQPARRPPARIVARAGTASRVAALVLFVRLMAAPFLALANSSTWHPPMSRTSPGETAAGGLPGSHARESPRTTILHRVD